MRSSDPNVARLLKEWGNRTFSLNIVADDGHGGREVRLETPLSDAALFGLYNLIAENLGLLMDPDIESGLFEKPDVEQLVRAEGEKIARESFVPYLVPDESLVWAMFMAAQVPALRPGVEISYLVSVSDRMLEEWRARWPNAAL